MAKKDTNRFGPFLLTKKLGEGSTGEVYLAKNAISNDHVALKIFRDEVVEAIGPARLKQQYLLMAQLKDPRVVPVLETGICEDKLWIAMTPLSEGTLEDAISAVPPEEACRIIAQIASGLEFIHARGILHLDLKPANIFHYGKGFMLADFGLKSEIPGKISGTPAYIAPEIIRGEYFDFRADLYSLGIVALELLTGQNPFLCGSQTETLQKQLQFEPQIPRMGKRFDPFRKLLRALIDKTPSKRPPSAYSVRVELQKILGEDPKIEEQFFLPEGPYIGRESEIKTILEAWMNIDAPKILSVRGPNGVGKTAFCERTRIELERTGAKTAVLKREKSAIARLFAPYFQEEYFHILGEYLPVLSCVADFPQSLLDELDIEPSKTPQSEAETQFLVVSAMEALTSAEPLFVAIFTPELNSLVKTISESRARIFALIDDGESDHSISLGEIDETSLKTYVHGIFGDIEGGNKLVEKLFENAKGNFAQTRQKLLSYGISGALAPETYSWRFTSEIADADVRIEKLWPNLEPAETIFATAVAFEGAVDSELAEKLVGGSSAKAAYSLIAKGLIREQFDKESIIYEPSRELRNAIGELIPAKIAERTKIRLAKAYLELESIPENLYRAAVNYIEANQPQKAYKPLYEAGNSFKKMFKYANAALAFETALQIDSYSPDLQTSIKTSKRLGLSRKYLGDFEGAREAYYRGMAMAEQSADEDQKASILSDIGVTFFEGGDPEKAVSFYDRAMDIHKYKGNEKGQLFDLVNKAGAYQTMKKYDIARKEYMQAINVAEKLGNSLAESVINLNLGEIYIAEGDFSSALPRILMAAKISKDKELGQILFRALLSLGRIYRRQGRRKLAEKAIEEAEELTSALGKRSSGVVLIEKAAIERVSGDISSAVSSISTALQYVKLLDKEELTELASEYAQLRGMGENLPPFPPITKIYDEMRPALEFIELAGKPAPSEDDFSNLLHWIAKVFDYEQEALGAAMLTYAVEHFMKKHDVEKASSLMDWAKAKQLSADPYVNGILAFHRAQINIAKGEIPAARHSLSTAISAFRELENDLQLAKTEKLKTILEEPQKQDESGIARLLPIIKALNSTLETKELILKILLATIDLTGAERGMFFVVANGGIEPLLVISADGEAIEKEGVKYSHSLIEKVIIKKEAAFSENIREDNELSSKSSIIDLELTMALCAPVLDAENRVEGLIYADSRIGKGSFDRGVIEIISALADQSAVALRNAERFDALRFEKDRMSRDYSGRFGDEILGSSRAVADLKRRLAVVAPKDISVLITGETGTGKELVAKTIHDGSSRRQKPFIAVNCAALPETLLESELFGHERGAFTGADSRHIGRFEQAGGGTIFLDEIAEMPIGLQAKLLRVIETRKVSRLGGSGEIEIDVRLIAATNREVEAAISEGVLRSDLYYRIAGVQIAIPALRERKEDIPELIAHFIAEADKKFGRDVESVSRTALSQMTAYPWFGNVRELISVIEEAVLFAPGKMLRPEDLPSKLQKAVSDGIVVADLPRSWAEFLRRKSDLVSSMEEQVLRSLLEKYEGRIVDAARSFKINRSQLHHLLKKHGIVTKE
jgi:transcriptional regulator with GAF, ATPase, and Fis domain/serine/threonine protein kinase/tetratricopeptide (TPR) repeat protein